MENDSEIPDAKNIPEDITNDISEFTPVEGYWFYKFADKNTLQQWGPFSKQDSDHLEQVYQSNLASDTILSNSDGKEDTKISGKNNVLIPTEDGRFEVNIQSRCRKAVYWEEDSTEVRRCSWFYRVETKARFLPFSEWLSERLETRYKQCYQSQQWERKFFLPLDEQAEELQTFVFHGPNTMVQHRPTSCLSPTAVSGVSMAINTEMQEKPILLYRGMTEILKHIQIPSDGWVLADHVVFVIHGMGPRCDLRGRTIVQCVDEMRLQSNHLIKRHFPANTGRVEFLPVNWHRKLHSAATDELVDQISLSSVPKMRMFFNDTLIDILFYSTSKYSQIIVNAVADEITRLKGIFLSRFKDFHGQFSIIGHSLGSVISFDLLSHQIPLNPNAKLNTHMKVDESSTSVSSILAELGLSSDLGDLFAREKINLASLSMLTDADLEGLGVKLGPRKLLLAHMDKIKWGSSVNSQIDYPQLGFPVAHLFALGSPIALFLTTRGLTKLELDYQLPTCPSFFNIFHPFDPVAYRFEKFVNPHCQASAVVVPHHKGRKRFHIELRENFQGLTTKVIDQLQSTWKKLNSFTASYRNKDSVDNNDATTDEEIGMCSTNVTCDVDEVGVASGSTPATDVGQLNSGRRFDYVLQEATFESLNDYVFAVASHACYWESQDTVLMILTEILAGYNVLPIESS